MFIFYLFIFINFIFLRCIANMNLIVFYRNFFTFKAFTTICYTNILIVYR